MMQRMKSYILVALILCIEFHYLRHSCVFNSSSDLHFDQIKTGTSCPLPREEIDLEFPAGFPQNLSFGRFRDQTGFPFLTQDFWADIVDNRRTFFLRPNENGFPSTDSLRKWIQSRPHPITLVLNNNQDQSWPAKIKSKDSGLLLDEENLHRVFAGNARNLSQNKKLKPIPIGLKWQWRSTQLFGENKQSLFQGYSKVSISEQASKQLFEAPNRTNTVWMRPMMNSNKRTRNYVRNTDALKTARVDISGILNQSAPLSLVTEKIDYFTGLKKNRFVISPAGNGLDTHATWEALLAGCIPIVPKSPLDSLFRDLPVWLIDSWSEVTDESVITMADRFMRGSYNWAKLFVPWWKKEIHKGLCHL